MADLCLFSGVNRNHKPQLDKLGIFQVTIVYTDKNLSKWRPGVSPIHSNSDSICAFNGPDLFKIIKQRLKVRISLLTKSPLNIIPDEHLQRAGLVWSAGSGIVPHAAYPFCPLALLLSHLILLSPLPLSSRPISLRSTSCWASVILASSSVPQKLIVTQ